jgi:hypothetical protein
MKINPKTPLKTLAAGFMHLPFFYWLKRVFLSINTPYMNPYFLDAGGVLLVAAPFLVFMILIVFAEALVFTLLKYKRFGASLGISAVINIASLLAGYLLIAATDFENIWKFVGACFIITLVVEAVLLWLFNKQKPWKDIITAALVANIISYGILALMISLLDLSI